MALPNPPWLCEMMPSTPLAWQLIQLNSHSKKTMMTSSKCLFLNDFRSIHPSDEVVVHRRGRAKDKCENM
ncbi:unnamed protein product [Brassica oleracea var. botrytis]